MRATLFLALLAGCPNPSKPGDTEEPVGGDDTAPPACEATVQGTSPEADESEVYYRDTLSVSFTADAADALVEVRDGSGAPIASTVTWAEGNLQAYVEADLEPSTAYSLHVEVCDVATDVAFQTSDLGSPLTLADADLVGRTYVFRLSDSKITQPAFLDAVAGAYLTVPLLIGVEAAGDGSIDFVGALGELLDSGSYVQIEGEPTWDFPPADFSDSPTFEAYAESITIQYGSIDIPVEDFVLSGTFTSDGSEIREGYATGFGDSRNMGPLVGSEDPGAICELAGNAGVECEACADGMPYCLYIVATEITAEYEAGLTLTPSP